MEDETIGLNLCILCKNACNEKQKNITEGDWTNLKTKSLEWKDLDKYHDVYDTVDWDSGSSGRFWHSDCKRELCGQRKLEQAKTRKRKHDFIPPESLIIDSGVSDINQASTSSRVSTRKSVGIVNQKTLCIWCMKGDDQKVPNRGKFHQLLEDTAWKKFKASVMYVTEPDVKLRLQTFIDSTPDPFATEVWYHDICRKKYFRPLYQDKDSRGERNFCNVIEKDVEQNFINYVSSTIIDDEEPQTLKQLCRYYSNMLENFGFFKTVKSDRLKDLLLHHFGEKLGFHSRIHRNRSDIVYNKNNGKTYYEAILNGSEVTDDELFSIAANRLKECIKNDMKNHHLEWPPTINKLCTEENVDSTFCKFLRKICNIKGGSKMDSKILFLSECVQSLVTKEKTQMKTVFTVTLHGLSRNREIVQRAYDLGVGIAYDSLLELHDCWAIHEFEMNEVCPSELADEKAGTVIIDNDDFKDDDLTGGTTSHRTNMMFVQPKKWIKKTNENISCLRSNGRKKLTELIHKENIIQNYKSSTRGEPPPFDIIDTSVDSTDPMKNKLVAHALLRLKSGEDLTPDEQAIGAFTGFMSTISPQQDQSKPYYFTTIPKPPSKHVVYTLMEKAEAAAKLKKMPLMQFVGDQPVYAHIVELKYENPKKISHILPVLGSFHIQMSYMKSIYKRLKESNIEDLLVEAGLIAEGSVIRALNGNHYNRATRLYKLFYEAMVRLIVARGEICKVVPPQSLDHLFDIMCDKEAENNDRYYAFQTVLHDEEFSDYVKTLFDLSGPNDHMANYILSIMNMIEILFMNIDSLRTKDWKGFLSSIRLMMPWMFVYDQTNYSRWLPVFWLEMSSLTESEVVSISEVFSQSLTGNSYSSLPPDLWIECTMNKGSKMKAGWKRLLKNEIGLHVHVKNANNISTVRHFLENQLSAIKGKNKHKENVKSRLRIDEQCVRDIISLVSEWECDPFDPEKQSLRTFQSGAYASEELVRDFESAYADGDLLVQKSIDKRLFSKAESIFDAHSKNNRKTFAYVCKPGDSKDSNIEMETKALVATLDLVTKNDQELLQQVFEHRVTDMCLSLFNANGTLRKCQKSKIVHEMHFKCANPFDYVAIVDMGLIWRLSTPSGDDRLKSDGKNYTWGDYADKLFNLILSRHSNATTIIAVNDYYGSDVINPKDGEHSKRKGNFLGGQTKNVFPSSDRNFPGKKEFQDFFRNPLNKIRLQSFLKSHFIFRCKDINKRFIYHERNNCEDISSASIRNSVSNFQCSHLEADTAMLFIYSRMRKEDHTTPVIIDSEDADVVVLCAYAASIINGDLYIKRKKAIIECKHLCPENMAKAVVQLHVATGCDTVSSFYGIGKKTVWKRVKDSVEAQELLSSLTDESLSKFVIKYVYNDRKSNTLGEMRATKWKRMKSKKAKSLARLGPDADSNTQRNRRRIYHANVLLNFQSPSGPPNPLDNGYYINNRHCIPIMYTKPSLPDNLAANISLKHVVASDDNESDSDESIDSSDGCIDDGLDI